MRARYGGVEASDILVQFARMELERPDALVMMQNGKFYEVYGHTARLLGRLLDLRVAEKPLMTARNGQPLMLAMTGITMGSEREPLQRLLRMGYRIALGREVEGERDGSVKARQLAEVLTPGTIFDEDLLDDERRLLASVDLSKGWAALAISDVSTGMLWCEEWSGPEAHDRLWDALGRFAPSEVLCSIELGREERDMIAQASGISRLEGERILRHRSLCSELGIPNNYHVGRMSPLPNWWFSNEAALEALQKHFQSIDLRPFGLHERPYSSRVLGALIRYLQWNRSPALARLQAVRFGGESHLLRMDSTTRRTLDILTGADGTPFGSLLAVLDQTRTPMGARLLKSWLTQGLRDREALERRYDAVQICVEQTLLREEIRRTLGTVGDLERVVNRLLIAPERATPRDMARLRDALLAAQSLGESLEGLGDWDLFRFDPLPELAQLLQRALAPAPRSQLVPRSDAEAGELLAEGWDAELDELLRQERQARDEIEVLVETLSLMHGLRSLQFRRDVRTRQIVLTVSAADARKVPSDWSRVAKGKEQYTTAQLVALSEVLNDLEDQRYDVERRAWTRLWQRIAQAGDQLMELAQAIAQIDLITCLAFVAVREQWTRPRIVSERILQIVNGRHPVVARTVEDYIPASLRLDDQSRLILLTGPNMSGKSTLMRMMALCVVLAQMGSFVPAEQMEYGLFDRIFTRIGASDDIASGRSTFLVEMSEVATIIHQATEDSLVVLDEVGRGTATFDGMALAEAIVEHLHSQIRCRGIFATHYHHLVEMIGDLPHVVCLQMGVHKHGDSLIFLHTLQPGVAEGSFGIAVAKMAGVPERVLKRARKRLAALEAEGQQRLLPAEQMLLNQVVQELSELDVEALPPEQLRAAVIELQRLCAALRQ